MVERDVIRLPPVNVRIGSCPDCGTPIWNTHRVHLETEHLKEVFSCPVCKKSMSREEVVPF